MKGLRYGIAVLVLLTGCDKEFSPYLEKARAAFTRNDYISTIDAVNAGLPYWNTADGTESKAEAYQLLGKSYHQLRNTDKAIEAYRQAVGLSDKTYDSAYALGILYLAASQPALAANTFNEALRMKPNDPLALLGLGNSYFSLKKKPEAIATFEKVLDVSPGVREAMESLALLGRPVRKRH